MLKKLFIFGVAALSLTACAGCKTEVPTLEDAAALTSSDGELAQALLKSHANIVYFDFDKYSLDAADKQKLDQVSDLLKKYPKASVVIEGHTDSIGTEKYNIGLGERRANSIKQYLTSKGGISSERLTIVSYGNSVPVADNSTPEGRAQNRRGVVNNK
ncbi:putative peptidoglycan-associated lipoprotein [Candidatus Fokinia solitaria]|uniref:Putative peptidoglycan-associated lipoprotein n=1 Tax=Candidatus Fokinia solitaria TaxID=1802984 RepID=A0A2U8BRW8_9RICK|nr:OmpA family protein [Candidatus Fokinia solitaria]AWD33082.1 putative peptidoglycan-associated lipoprotein [Candidatus Fokinia solitaria]